MKWTDAQQAAIDAPKPGSLASQTLLVAAAAGSGKPPFWWNASFSA